MLDANIFSLSLIFGIMLIHTLADFSLQTEEQATMKSSSDQMLFNHVLIYSAVWFLVSLCYYSSFLMASLFTIITFMSHYITDYYTSRLSKKFFNKKDYHNGFLIIGFDQLLHYLQLFLTYSIFNFIF